MASSSSIIDNSEHDVFVSFRGEDTRNNFTSHLIDALRRANIRVFIDRMLDKGEVLTPSLHRAIERAKISVVIFSSGYACSSFCLDELVKILECKESKAQIVLPIFYKVDPSDLRKLKGTFEEAFSKHESEFKGRKRCREETSEEETKMQRWKSALVEAANLSGWHVQITDTCDETETIGGIIQQISRNLNCEPTSKSKGQELISIPLVGESTAVANLEKIWKCLMDNNISRVGIHGMGGIGKTTIVTHINNRLIRDANSFQHVYWVTVSRESSIYKLQSNIAEKIKLDLSREEDERERATKLWEALNKKKRFVLILDDMWESFELEEEVGIPISAYGGKLLLTTREHGVCKRMKCDGIVKVQPLLKEEAMDLFIRECAHQIDDNPELRDIVESVVKECDGLPLAIKAIAKSTREFAAIHNWRNILNELQKPSERQNHDMEKVFNLLKVSYDLLQTDKHRQCLCICAMYGEDCWILRSEVISYLTVGGLFDELDSRQEEIDMGNTIFDGLVDASLLEGGQYGFVKMHDVVRDMVLAIMRGKLLVKAGVQHQDFPKFTDWSADLEGISIMSNYNLKGCSFNWAPNCFKLRILLMQKNGKLSELPNCFFVHMQSLTILDMSCLYSLKLLPHSISMLESLRMLNLERCYYLEYVPCLAALKDLRHLDLSRTNLKNLPEGMEKLVNLKLLRFMLDEERLGLISGEFLKELAFLEELELIGSNVEVDPDVVISLQKLETLKVEFENFDALNSYLVSRHWQRLGTYEISTKKRKIENDDIWCNKELSWCKEDSPLDWDFVARNGESADFVIPYNVENLELMKWDGQLDAALNNGCFSQLKRLTLWKCKLKFLISVAFFKQLLQNLECLEVGECPFIEEIIETEKSLNQSNHKNYPTIELPNLRSLVLEELPRLRRIYKGNMELPSLEFLMIDDCDNLERLPFRDQPDDFKGSNIDSKLWWDSLKWDDQNHKQVFQDIISELEIETE